MVSLYDDMLLGGDWGDLFASGPVDSGAGVLKKDVKGDEGCSSFLTDLLGDEDLLQTANLNDDYLGQSTWMDTWTELGLSVPAPLDPVEEILQQAERIGKPEAMADILLPEDSILQQLLHVDATSQRCPSPVEEVPPLIHFKEMPSLETYEEVPALIEFISADQFSPLTPPLSPDDIDSILSDPSSPGSSTMEDPDWLPESPGKPVKTHSKLRPKPYEKPTCVSETKSSNTTKARNTTTLSKKERKREQNKNAAIRYREKKRAESENVVSEEVQLEEKNKTLKNKVESITNEIQYLKDLLREVYKAKGLKLDQKLLS